MSFRVVIEEIKRLLADPDPEAVCIQGKWGVGKTFAWKKYLDESRQGEGSLALKRYSYVSLFGINSLNDLRQSIFENTYEKDIEDSFGVNKNFVSGLNILKKIFLQSGLFSKYINGLDRLAFLLVRRQIVCIDDLERVGEGLSISDVLGLVSFLKTERQCKVVVLMNNGELSEEQIKVFEKQKEKVFDVVLTFEPTASEAASIVFSSPSIIQELVKKNSIILGITNIRVIKKIEKNCTRLLEIIKEYPKLHPRAIHSVALFTWSVLQPSEAPSIDFLKKFRRHIILGKNSVVNDDETRWMAPLAAYGYSHTDEFDLLIIDGIKNGYFGIEEFHKTAKKFNDLVTKENRVNSVRNSWDALHDSFDDNEADVVGGIYNASLEHVDVLTPSDLNSAVKILKEFNQKEQADILIKKYIEIRGREQDLFNIKKYAHRIDVDDVDVINAFNEQFETFKDTRNPATILVDTVKNNGWNQEDIELIQKLTMDDFIDIFKSAKGDDLPIVIEGALQFSRIHGIAEDVKAISDKAIKALKQIGEENRLNKKRVAAYGVVVDD